MPCVVRPSMEDDLAVGFRFCRIFGGRKTLIKGSLWCDFCQS